MQRPIDAYRLRKKICEKCRERTGTDAVCINFAHHTGVQECDIVQLVEEAPTVVDKRYPWHDLTEDPKDLPEDNRDVLVCYRQRLTGRENYEVNWRMESEWSGEEDYDMLYWNVVAWRDIEPFEE